MKDELYIEQDKDGTIWLKDGKEPLMGYESLEQLQDELKGAIEVGADGDIKLLDEEKLLEKLIFL
jgi:hypothetical protein